MSPCIFHHRSKLVVLRCALAIFSVLAIRPLAECQAPEAFPKASGEFAVGRTVIEWRDNARANRPIHADFWYPALPGGKLAPYCGELKRLLNNPGSAAEMKDLVGSHAETFLRVPSHSYASAKPAPGHFPLLVFSPGLGLSPFLYSMQIEDLASRGYVIAALSHPGDTGSFVLQSGEIVRFDDAFWNAHPPNDANVEVYREHAEAAAADMIFAIAALKTGKGNAVSGIIDFEKIGAFGHSQGGRAAADVCQLQPSVRACLNEDGTLDETSNRRPYWPISGRSYPGSFEMLDWFDPGLSPADYASMHTDPLTYARARLSVGDSARAMYERVRGRSCRVTLLEEAMSHLSFTDLKLLTARTNADRKAASANLQAINSVVGAFFDQELKGKGATKPDSHDVVLQCFSNTKQKPRQ